MSHARQLELAFAFAEDPRWDPPALEEALALYERGVALQGHLDRLLADAELRIRRLVERSGGRLDAVEHREAEPSG